MKSYLIIVDITISEVKRTSRKATKENNIVFHYLVSMAGSFDRVTVLDFLL